MRRLLALLVLALSLAMTTPAQIVTVPPPPAPAPATSSERKSDIVPRGEWEPPRKRVIDTSNPYGDEK
jgi:hypothetical protein